MTLSPILTFEWDSPSLSMILGFRSLQKLIPVLRFGIFLIFKFFCILTFLWPWALCRPFCEIATSKQMILSFKIFSIALSSPKIWRFKVGSYMFVCYSGVSTTGYQLKFCVWCMVWLQCAWPLLEFRHWEVLGGAPVYTDTLQHLPASSRGQTHFLKSTKVVPGLYWKPGTGRCCCVHRHTAAPPSLLQSPVEASYTQLGSLQLLIWNIDGFLWGPPHFFFNAPINYPYTQ